MLKGLGLALLLLLAATSAFADAEDDCNNKSGGAPGMADGG